MLFDDTENDNTENVEESKEERSEDSNDESPDQDEINYKKLYIDQREEIDNLLQIYACEKIEAVTGTKARDITLQLIDTTSMETVENSVEALYDFVRRFASDNGIWLLRGRTEMMGACSNEARTVDSIIRKAMGIGKIFEKKER